MADVQIISRRELVRFCCRWHYSNVFPPHMREILGCDDKDGLACVAAWGWGMQPLHTIRAPFPSLGVDDYRALNRLCARDELPRNTESHFLAQCAEWIKQHTPKTRILFSWADGIRGKPGYVYQGAGWLYGGFITTEIYVTPSGEPVHPRLMITRFGSRAETTWQRHGLTRIRGRLFRYARFLCSHGERKRLLRESTVAWTQDYPKQNDCVWQLKRAGEASRETRDAPSIERSGQFRHPAPLFAEKE